MEKLLKNLETIFKGEIAYDPTTKTAYSHDASIFELTPEAILYPKNSADIGSLVRFASERKTEYPTLSITARSGGTDMSGGPLSQSLIIDMTRYFNKIKKVTATSAEVEPGVYYRDFDPISIEHAAQIGSVPASRDICTLGGMVANNSGGERSLQYGNTENFVMELKVIFADGKEYVVKPLTKPELVAKMSQGDFEGELYRKVFDLIESDYDRITTARPHTSKNSMGYNLWAVWDRKTGVFDMTKLIVGSQGTLGIVTDIKFRLVPRQPYSGLLVCFMRDTDQLGTLIPAVMAHKPATFEGFDDITFDLGIKYFSSFRQKLGTKEFLRVQASLLPDIIKFKNNLPKLVLMIEFDGPTPEEVARKIATLQADLADFNLETEVSPNESESKKFWLIRRASFNLLRQKVKDKYAAPFIDDLAVEPQHLPKFLPELRKIIKKYKLPATIAGHFGDGNFHIIPLMSIEKPREQAKLEPTMREVMALVLKYRGTLAGEHNDGMVRGPWLADMFGKDMFNHFKTVKHIFDEQNIFNPHKKTDASWAFSTNHIRTSASHSLIK